MPPRIGTYHGGLQNLPPPGIRTFHGGLRDFCLELTTNTPLQLEVLVQDLGTSVVRLPRIPSLQN